MSKGYGLLELHVPALKTSFPLFLDPWPSGIEEKLPLRVELLKWKQEIYFTTPIKPETYKNVPLTTRVQRGILYYWPPGTALCIFYGISQIYTPGHPAGIVLGPLHTLEELGEGEEGELREPSTRITVRLARAIKYLHDKGYYAAPALQAGDPIIAAGKFIKGKWVPLFLYEESGYIMAESEPLFKYGEGANDSVLLKRLERLVEAKARLARLDLDEEGRVIISGVFAGGEVEDFLVDFERLWGILWERLFQP